MSSLSPQERPSSAHSGARTDGAGARTAGAGARSSGMRRRPRARWFAAVMVLVPILELAVFVAVERAIGLGWLLVLVLAKTAFAAWFVRREGVRSWRAVQSASRAGLTPTREVADAALVPIGGLLLVIPGFITDVTGLFLILPITRPVARTVLSALVARRILGSVAIWTPMGPRDFASRDSNFPPGGSDRSFPSGGSDRSSTIRGEVID